LIDMFIRSFIPGLTRRAALCHVLTAAIVLLAAPAAIAASSEPASVPAARTRTRGLAIAAKPWRGDFDGMLMRRMIRDAIPDSRSLYLMDKGRERGISLDLVRDFERWLNKKYARELGSRPLTIYVAAMTRDKLFAALEAGQVDIAAGNLTVTEEREKVVDFVALEAALNVEIAVTGAGTAPLGSVEDLSGRTVHVRRTSSYYESLEALNERLRQEGKPAVDIALVPDALEDEDMLEMVNAGLLESIIVDQWKARMWAQVLPNVAVREDIVVRPGTPRGWAIRKQSPKLAAEISDAYANEARKMAVIPYRQRQYMKTIKALHSASAAEDQKRFRAMLGLFDKYGGEYNFDPLMLAAQGYQESKLDPKKKSPGGAIGVMQLMPATGKQLQVGDIRVTDANIHAAAKYMDHLMSRYFSGADFNEQVRTLFAFASYNAGPAKIAKMRTEAEKRGLDPNKWFNNVEIVTAEKIGIETTTYVRNIYKYYVSYKLTMDAQAAANKLKSEAVPAASDK
jgi:membrane-bound lytic murein transglycosylase MltF